MASWQVGLLFPWSILLIPAIWRVLCTVAQWHPLEWQEAFPLVWAIAGFCVALADPGRTIFESLLFWPAFAVWAATRLEITPRWSLLRAIGFVLAFALASLFVAVRLENVLASAAPAKAEQLLGIPDFFWPSVTSVAFVSLIAFILLVGTGFWFEYDHRRRFALLAMFAAMIPAGYAFTDTMAKFAPYLSLADIARCISPGHDVKTFFDGDPERASSLKFYMDAPFSRAEVGDNQLETAWKGPAKTYLITRRGRLPAWSTALRKPLGPAFQSGINVLVTNGSEPTDSRAR
jgi:hypothetical protein